MSRKFPSIESRKKKFLKSHLGREARETNNDDVSNMAEGGGIDDAGW